MILVLLWWGKDALSSKVKKDNCWSEQSPKKLTVPVFFAHPVYVFFLLLKAVFIPLFPKLVSYKLVFG